jgi:hypothetical protein
MSENEVFRAILMLFIAIVAVVVIIAMVSNVWNYIRNKDANFKDLL